MTTATIDKSIDVDCSQHDAFDKLSRVDTYTQFQSRLADVQEIQARGPNTAHIVGIVDGQREEADIELDPVPEERIDYHIRAETPMEGSLTLLKLDEHHTTLQLHAEFDPQKVSDTYHLSQQDLDRRLQERLEAMKSIVEGKE